MTTFPMLGSGHHVVIRHLESCWLMTLDGQELKAVRDVQLRACVNEVTSLLVEFYPGGIEIEADAVRSMHRPALWFPGMSLRAFYQNLRAWARFRWHSGWGVYP